MVSSDEINRRLKAKRRGVKYQEPLKSTSTDTLSDSKECPSCHTQNPSTAKFCVGCGEKLETPSEEKGFSPEIKGSGSEAEESTTVEKPIKSTVTQRPDDFGRKSIQKIKSSTTEPGPSESKKLEPIVPEKPEPETTPESEQEIKSTETEPITTEPTPKSPEPPQIKRPESIPTPEVKKPTPTPEPKLKETEPSTQEEKPKSDIDPVERIKKAKELLDIGAITQEEFDIIKNKYLEEI